MPNTYVALATQTLGSATASVTFSSIPQGYTDLVIVVVPATTSGNDNLGLRVGNGSVDTGSNYSVTVLTGNGSAASSDRQSNQTSFLCDYYGSTGATLGNNIKVINIMNYSNTTTNKTILLRANRADSGTDAIVGLWRSTVAINTVTLFGRGGSSFAVGSTFSLYGIASSGAGAKATGGTVYSDSQYFYHVFNASGTFTPTQSITADVLVVAGGGGGGPEYYAGGGGAGGVPTIATQSLVATNYTVTIGAGGVAIGPGSSSGNNGNDSQFGSTTAAIGGGGGGVYSNPTGAKNGGSGGGAGGDGGGGGALYGTAGTGSQGNNGGRAWAQSGGMGSGGGGGGYGSAGVNGSATNAGNGGSGLTTYSSWASATSTGVGGNYAGGGGGGCFNVATAGTASAGGGAGGKNANGTNGTANTGGGGGGGGGNTSGGAGGSGIVIVRYAK